MWAWKSDRKCILMVRKSKQKSSLSNISPVSGEQQSFWLSVVLSFVTSTQDLSSPHPSALCLYLLMAAQFTSGPSAAPLHPLRLAAPKALQKLECFHHSSLPGAVAVFYSTLPSLSSPKRSRLCCGFLLLGAFSLLYLESHWSLECILSAFPHPVLISCTVGFFFLSSEIISLPVFGFLCFSF